MRQIDLSSGKWLLFLCSLFFSVIFPACKKELSNLKPAGNNVVSGDTSGYVVGAHGELISKKNFHILEKGYKLAIQNQRIYKVEIASGKFVEDFGEYKPATRFLRNGVSSSRLRDNVYGTSLGWAAATEWDNTASNPINLFTATCVVPPMPATQVNQTFAFWIGLTSVEGGYGDIVQPILNYGQAPESSAENTYQVFNYFLWADGAAMTTPVTVSSGSTIKYSISYSGPTGSSYDYVSNVLNSAGDPITPTMDITVNYQYLNGQLGQSGYVEIPTVPETNSAYTVLEDPFSPGITSSSEYPNTSLGQSYVAITNITVSTGTPTTFTYPSPLAWKTVNTSGGQLGENAQIVSTNNNNTNSPGQIKLWYATCNAPTSPVSGPMWTNSTQTLSWGAVSGATQYQVIINSGPDAGAWYSTTSTSIPNFFRTIEQPAIPGNYQVIILPQNSCGNGPNTYFNFTYTN